MIFKDDKGGIYDVPETDLPEFRKAVPGAIPAKAFFDKDGHTYAVPENEMEEFSKAVPGAMEADSIRRPGFMKQLGAKFVSAPVKMMSSQAASPAVTRLFAPDVTLQATAGEEEFQRKKEGIKAYEKNVLPEGREADYSDLQKAKAAVMAMGPMGAFGAGKTMRPYTDRVDFERYAKEAAERSLAKTGGKELSSDATTWPVTPSQVFEESEFAKNIEKSKSAVNAIFAKQQDIAKKIDDKLTPDGVAWADRFSDSTKHNPVAKAVLDATDNWPQIAVAVAGKGLDALVPGLGSALAYGVMSAGESSDFMRAATQMGVPASFALPYAEKYGLLSGGVEYSEQLINVSSLGFGGRLTGKVSQKSVEKLTKVLGKEVLAKVAAKTGGVALNAIGEGTEELVQGALQYAYLADMVEEYGKKTGTAFKIPKGADLPFDESGKVDWKKAFGQLEENFKMGAGVSLVYSALGVTAGSGFKKIDDAVSNRGYKGDTEEDQTFVKAYMVVNPEGAAVVAKLETPSRGDFEKAGLPRMPAKARARVASDLRELGILTAEGRAEADGLHKALAVNEEALESGNEDAVIVEPVEPPKEAKDKPKAAKVETKAQEAAPEATGEHAATPADEQAAEAASATEVTPAADSATVTPEKALAWAKSEFDKLPDNEKAKRKAEADVEKLVKTYKDLSPEGLKNEIRKKEEDARTPTPLPEGVEKILKTAPKDFADLTDAELDAMMDAEVERRKPTQITGPKPAKPTAAPKIGVKNVTKAADVDSEKAKRQLSEIAASAAKHGVAGLGEASKGLYELFGANKRLGMGVTFDEGTYSKAKPHFAAALKEFRAAGKDAVEFVRWAFESFGEGVRPYLKQFKNEVVNERARGGQGSDSSADAGNGKRGPAEDGGASAADGGAGGQVGGGAGADGDVRAAKQDAVGGGSGDGVRPETVGVAGQQAAGGVGENVPVPAGKRLVADADGSNDGSESAHLGESGTVSENLDLRGSPPVRLARGARRSLNDQAKAVLAKAPGEITPEDREILRQYTGEGGLSSGSVEALNQHYTDYDTIRAMYAALSKAGVPMARTLEPGAGAGNFVGNLPGADWTTVDIDETNHKVLSALYPKAKNYHMSYEGFTGTGFDLVISNVPFLEVRERGTVRPDIKALHDFYFVHSLDRVRENGVIAFITSTGTMDKADDSVRKEIVSKGDIIGAFRLPQGHFSKNAHTDVTTDIIFIQKRPDGVPARPEAKARNDAFVESVETEYGFRVNSYYDAFPENILGEANVGQDKLHGGKPMLVVTGDADLSAVSVDYKPYSVGGDSAGKKKIKGKQGASGGGEEGVPENSKDFFKWADDNNIRVMASDHGRYGENVHTYDGEIFELDREVGFTDVTLKAKIFRPVTGGTVDKIRALSHISQLADQFQKGDKDASGQGLAEIQEYKEKFGTAPVKDRELKRFFKNQDEMSYFSVLSSTFDENFDPAEVFLKQVRHEGGGKIKSSQNDDLKTQAIAAEDNKGFISFPTQDGHVTQDDVPDLLRSGYALAGFDTDGSKSTPVLQNDILYYSGNIYQKIRDAKESLKLAPENVRPLIADQIARLEEIRPEPKPAETISFKGTEPWVSGVMREAGVHVNEEINSKTGIREYSFSSSKLDPEDVELIEKLANSQALVRREDDESEYSFSARMKEAEEKLSAARDHLREIVLEDDARREKLEHAYNSTFRNYVKPNYEKASYLIKDVLDDIARNAPKTRNPVTRQMEPLRLRANQTAWVIQALYEGKGVNAHDVGGGKTMAAIVLGAALKRRGRAQKPMYVVPAKTIKKWVRETKLLFPDAKIVDLGNLTKDKRKAALMNLANSNADYVFISHEGFEQIKLPVENEVGYVEDVMNEHVDDPDAKGREKALITMKKNDYVKALRSDGRDTRITWDRLGVDCVIADEAHAFKNIGINNKLVGFGLGKPFGFNPAGTALKSSRSYDFRFKCNFTSDNNNGGNVFLLTATPTPNKPMETFVMLRHLARDIFGEYGITNDRDFARQFFELGNHIGADGRNKQLLKRIVNAQELRGLLNRFVDKVDMENMPWITVPEAKEKRVFFDTSLAYMDVAEDLQRRRRSLPHPSKKGDDTLVAIYTGGRSASVDPRLYGGGHAGESFVDIERSGNSKDDKIQWTIEHVAAVGVKNKEAGQIVFLDDAGFTQVERGQMGTDLHSEIKRELIGKGFDAREIAIINGKVITNPATGKEAGAGADSAQKKSEIERLYNEGKIKVVIGSTQSMGEGMDLQVKTTDIYHLDIPYTPGAIRQRNGRGVRYGNENKSVNIYYLMMRGSFDSLSFDIVSQKRGWNDAIWDKNTADDVISTEEEMADGAIPSDKQIQIELERDPVRRKVLEVRFQEENMARNLDSIRNNIRAVEGMRRTRVKHIQKHEAALADRQSRLSALKPDDSIKDEKKRSEKLSDSQAYVEKLIAHSIREIGNENAKLEEVNEKIRGLQEMFQTRLEEMRDHHQRWFNDDGSPKVTDADIVPEEQDSDADGDDGFQGYAPKGPQNTLRSKTDKNMGIKKVKPVNAGEIVSEVKTMWPTLTLHGKGTFRRKKYAGWYTRAIKEIRTKDRRDIETVMHELGHYFDDQLDGWSKKYGGNMAIRSELIRLGKSLYGSEKPKGGYRAEGFAEFIRGYLTGQEIERDAPETFAWFTSEYLPDNHAEAVKVAKLADMIERFRVQTPEQAVRAFRTPQSEKWNAGRVASMIAGLEDNWRDKHLFVLRDMLKSGFDSNAIAPADHPYMLLTAFSRSAGRRAYHSVVEETTDIYGTHTGEGLKQALSPVTTSGETYQNWLDYAVARVAQVYHGRGMVSGLSPADADAVVAKHESPEFRDALDRVTAWSRRLLHTLVENGAMTQEEFDKIEEENPVYVKFMRHFLEHERGRRMKSAGLKVQRKTGGTVEIENPVDAMIVDAERFITMAMQAKVVQSVVRLYDENKGKGGPVAKWLSEVPAQQYKVSFTADRIKRQIADLAKSRMGVDEETADTAMEDDWDEMMSVFLPSAEYKGKDNIVSVVIDGKRRFFEVDDPKMLDLIKGMRSEPENSIVRVSRLLIGTQRLGATGLNPAFGIVRNMIRDTATASVTADYHFHIPLVSTITGTMLDILNTDVSRVYHAVGIDIAGAVGQSLKSASRISGIATSANKFQRLYREGIIGGVVDILSHTEVGPRLMEFRGALDHGRRKWGRESDAMILATCAAKDVTVDFSRAGKIAQQMNAIILFFNAAVRSIDKALTSLGVLEASPWAKVQDRKQMLARTLARSAVWLTAGSILNYLRNRDDEWWKELPPHEKWGFTHVKMYGRRIRLPLPFEIGMIFGALPCALLEESRTPGAFKEALGITFNSLSPVDIGWSWHKIARNVSAIGPVIDVLANRDWKGSQIVPQVIADSRLPKDQYTTGTSDLSIFIGQHINAIPLMPKDGISPAKLDHLLNGYTGGLYRRLIKMIDTAIDPSGVGAGGDLSTIPLVGTLFLRKGTSRLTGDFYDRMDSLRKMKGSGEASLEEIGELSASEKTSKTLSEKFRLRRESMGSGKSAGEKRVESNDIMEEVFGEIRKHNAGKDSWRKIGIGTVAQAATDPSANDADREYAKQLLSGVSRPDIIASMRAKNKEAGNKVSVMGKNFKPTSYGKRLRRLNELLSEE